MQDPEYAAAIGSKAGHPCNECRAHFNSETDCNSWSVLQSKITQTDSFWQWHLFLSLIGTNMLSFHLPRYMNENFEILPRIPRAV